MKIAQIAPLFEAVPPSGYGGTERVVAWLSEELVALGHDVTLFAADGGSTRANFISSRDQPLRTDPDLCCDIADHSLMLSKVRDMADEFDIIHCHTDLLQMLILQDYAEKTLTTLHGRLDFKGLSSFLMSHRSFPLISISNHQRLPAPRANYISTVYHGLPENTYVPNFRTDQKYVAFLGRFSPEKGADKAIRIAQEVGWPIKLAAKICRQNRTYEAYYENVIRPLLALPGVEFLDEIGDRQKNDFLGNAKALLFPIDWPEPFGLVMIEAMACGTPVIAYKAGSVPEILEDGVTGFIVKTESEAIDALNQIHRLDRRAIRHEFEKRFTSRIMAQAYCDVYEYLALQNEARSRSIIIPEGLETPRGFGVEYDNIL